MCFKWVSLGLMVGLCVIMVVVDDEILLVRVKWVVVI